MTSSMQAMIDQANSKHKKDTQRVFAKKANERGHHNNLLVCAELFLEAYYNAYKAGMVPPVQLLRAAREAETAIKLSKKFLEG
jgi:hypothetical protein